MIPLSIPNLGEAEAEAVARVVRDGWVSTAGPQVAEFEARLADYCGARFAVATQSGTAALHLALLAAGVSPGNLVLVPSLTFVASANAVRYCGADPVLVDVSAETGTMDASILKDWLEKECERKEGKCVHRASGRIIPALLYVHTIGYRGNLDAALSLAEEWNLVLVEDAAAAMGSFHGWEHVGTTGRFGCLSFNGNKIMTTGGGGAILLDDPIKAEHLRHLATQARRHYAEYLHDETGYNYRMTNMAAALGLAQLDRMPEFLSQKREIHSFYQHSLRGVAEMFPISGDAPNHWLTTILHPEARMLEDYLEVMGIEARKLWIPLSKLPMFSDCILISPHNNAMRLYEQSLCLPCSTGIPLEDLEFVADTVTSYLNPEAP